MRAVNGGAEATCPHGSLRRPPAPHHMRPQHAPCNAAPQACRIPRARAVAPRNPAAERPGSGAAGNRSPCCSCMRRRARLCLRGDHSLPSMPRVGESPGSMAGVLPTWGQRYNRQWRSHASGKKEKFNGKISFLQFHSCAMKCLAHYRRCLHAGSHVLRGASARAMLGRESGAVRQRCLSCDNNVHQHPITGPTSHPPSLQTLRPHPHPPHAPFAAAVSAGRVRGHVRHCMRAAGRTVFTAAGSVAMAMPSSRRRSARSTSGSSCSWCMRATVSIVSYESGSSLNATMPVDWSIVANTCPLSTWCRSRVTLHARNASATPALREHDAPCSTRGAPPAPDCPAVLWQQCPPGTA